MMSKSVRDEGKQDEEEKSFETELNLGSCLVRVSVPMKLPFEEIKIPEFTQLIITSFSLPTFVEEEIEKKLEQFVKQANHECLSKYWKIDESKVEQNIRLWEQAFREETLQFNPPEIVGDDEVFAEAYHSLVHSPMLAKVLRKEGALNSIVREMHREKNKEIQDLTESQEQEMSIALASLNLNNSTADVNRLNGTHFEEAHLVRTRHQSLIESEFARQKRDFRNWVMKHYQDYFIEAEDTTKAKGKKKLGVTFDDSLLISYNDEDTNGAGSNEDNMLQESFTIHLGSQQKQMYNIRLMCCHPLDFLRFKNESSREISPQRLQMAISLYSTDVSGIVLLTDPDISCYRGMMKDLMDLTQQTTEFHFESLESQIQNWPKSLKPGDYVLSRHSNLNGAHVVFHLVADTDNLDKSEINSRHPVILGLRNILKTACLNDITTITIPALLAHEMAEFMTVSWCNRRAELVYKCVKGFMIEMASWGGAEMKNLQFLAPQDISDDVFNSLASMLPNIFRVSNPLRLSTSSSSHSLQHQLSH